MIATTFEVVDRPQHPPFRGPDLRNFHLGETGQLPAGKILENPHITLYGLDLDKRQAIFVETPAGANLSHAPFYSVAEFEKAERIWTVSFETMLQLAQSVTIDDRRLVLIYSVGRCGSTLASQVFAQVPGVTSISEPFALVQLVVARNTKAADDDELVALLRATVRLLCKTPAETAWVIKGQSFVIELGDWLHEIYPQTRNLFLYRHAETWLQSGLRAYSNVFEGTEEERRARENERRAVLGPLVPSIAQYDAELLLSHAEMLALMWLRAMERYVQFCNMGMEMLAIRYASWRSAPRETAEAMLEYCRCRPADMTAIYQTLNRDSQAGTRLSREALDQRARAMTERDLEDLHRHLQRHAFIHEPDFEVPNTLKL